MGDKKMATRRSGDSGLKINVKKLKECTLGGHNLRLAVTLPEGEDLSEWLAVNVVDFYSQTNMLYGTISQFCTEETCPVMNAGAKYEYYWADGQRFKKATKFSAPEYVQHLMEWIKTLIEDETSFPQKMGAPFPRNFLSVVKQIFKRLS